MAGILLCRNFGQMFKTSVNLLQVSIRNKSEFKNDHRVVTSADGKVVVCWHPETEYLYENTLPVTLKKEENTSVLKVRDMGLFHNMKPEFQREKLMALTYTTKHRWFPPSIHKLRRKRNWERKREYL